MDDPSKLLRIVRRRSAAGSARSSSCTPLPTALSATEIRLQQMRQRMHITQLAILYPKEMRIWCASAAVCVSGAEGAEHHDRTDRGIDDEAMPVARTGNLSEAGRGDD